MSVSGNGTLFVEDRMKRERKRRREEGEGEKRREKRRKYFQPGGSEAETLGRMANGSPYRLLPSAEKLLRLLPPAGDCSIRRCHCLCPLACKQLFDLVIFI